MDSLLLPGKSTLLELGMLKIDPEGTLKETSEMRIKRVRQPSDEYSEVFQGIGCFRDKHTDKKIKVKLEMDAKTVPVAQKLRPIPYHL